ncbi:MAG: hypothetical protein F4Z64_15115, partial [Acidimicrobiaceae bacterium]|nr:hypothetical protein [Acidimicrobiaceae bacterium]
MGHLRVSRRLTPRLCGGGCGLWFFGGLCGGGCGLWFFGGLGGGCGCGLWFFGGGRCGLVRSF